MRHSSLLALAAQNLVLLSACGASPASVQGDVASTSQSCTAPAAPSEGYKLVRDGKLVRRERTWTRSQGVANCKRNINRHTQERVACYFDAKPLGYELLMDGARVGYEPGWTRSQGVANCEQTFNQAPQTSVACYYDGTRLGYELFWDGTRVDYEPGWTRSQGVTNCEWNVHQFPQKNVECDYEGSRLGYELFWDGERVRHEPGWSESRAIRNCARSRRTYSADLQLARPGAWLKCLYDGVPVFQPIPSPTCGGVPTYIVRTESGLCQRVAGWDTCPLDPNVSSTFGLCVYQFSRGQPSAANLSDLTAISSSRWGWGNPSPSPHALEVCGPNRPTCSSSLRSAPSPAVACDPNATKECCEALLAYEWVVDVDGKAVCQRLGSTGATGCNRCGFGYVQNGVLAVVLDPRNTQRSEYYADMSTNAGSERMKFEPPQGEQLFSVFVGTHVLDGSVSEIGPDGELQGQ